MTSACCFQGLLAHIRGSSFQTDVAAELKLAHTYNKRKNQSRSSLDSLDDVEENNTEPSSFSLTNKFRKSFLDLQKNNRTKGSFNQSHHGSSRKRGSAKSFDDSDSESSSDSDEETLRNFRKTIRGSKTAISKDHLVDNNAGISSDRNRLNCTPSLAGSLTELQQTDKPLVDMEEPSTSQYLDPAKIRTSNVMLSGGEVEERDWTMEDVESIYSREVSSSLVEEDEIAAAIAVKPPIEEEEEEKEVGEEMLISTCGTLDIALQYFLTEKKLQITIVGANDLPSKDRGGASIIQVHAVVLPAKRKRYKTKVQHINSPYFHETFKLSHITPEDLKGLGLRLRLYGIGKVRDRLIGEASVMFDELNLIRDPQLTVTLQMEPRADVNRSDFDQSMTAHSEQDVSSAATLAHGGSLPELLLSLAYDEMTGRLSVEVVKGSHFRNLSMSKPPDTFVKLVLLNSSCQEMAQSKTTVRRSQPNPVFKETFYFQVALFQLAEVSLMVSVYCNRTIKRKSMLGWISMGRNSSCEFDEQHWTEMRGAKGKAVSRWHTLIDS